jgi:hypothetical protein
LGGVYVTLEGKNQFLCPGCFERELKRIEHEAKHPEVKEERERFLKEQEKARENDPPF